MWWLYATTILMSAGVAIMQPALPPLVRAWLPRRVSFGTALYTNGLLVGEIIPVMLTLPLLLPLLDNSWRWSLAVWGIPVVAIALATQRVGAVRAAGHGAGCRRPKLVAELARSADLAARPAVRLRQLRLLLHQRLPAGAISPMRAGPI